MKQITFLKLIFLCVMALLLAACSHTRPYTLKPIKKFDPDTADIPKPEPNTSYQYWDRIDNTIFHQLEKPLNLNRSFRFLGRMLGVAQADQADNVNRLDQVPESSWYNYRHYHDPMSPRELARGPNTVEPDTSQKWTIFLAKIQGANPGFFIKDANGNRFLIKFDGPKYPELTTSAEVISTKFFYAAGYNVPQATITYFNPKKVTIGEDVQVMEHGEKRLMTQQDYRQIIKNKPRNKNGKVRALASKFVDGQPVGHWSFEGTRENDPNDRVAHEHRREIRGMRIISSWLNDTDRRDANTMTVYTEENYIKHYVQDFGNTLGANGAFIHEPIYGQSYLIDPRYMALSAISLGTYVRPWETIDARNHIPYPSVGYFRAEVFRPGRWVSAHPLPAYENMTLRDAFWGAKLVTSFTEEDIRAIVETGQITNSAAEDYLVRVLKKRRDKIGRYWFSRINPIAKFTSKETADKIILDFKDLGLRGNIFDSSRSYYEYSISLVDGGSLVESQKTETTRIIVNQTLLSDQLEQETPPVLKYDIVTRRKNPDVAEKNTAVYVALETHGPRIVGIQREE